MLTGAGLLERMGGEGGGELRGGGELVISLAAVSSTGPLL